MEKKGRCRKVSLSNKRLPNILKERKIVSKISQTTSYINSLKNSKETPFCTFLKKKSKAVYTVETAIAFFLFFCVLIAFILYIRLMAVTYLIRNELDKSVVEYAATVGSKRNTPGDKMLLEKQALILKVKTNIAKKKCTNFIKGGFLGMDFKNSYISDEFVVLDCSFQIKRVVPFFNSNSKKIREISKARRFIGWNPMIKEENRYVYVTKNGVAYHNSLSCPYLNPSVKSVSRKEIKNLRNFSGGKYKRCSCMKGYKGNTVYITKYGNLYHGNISCNKLKRVIKTINIKDAEKKYHKCPKCGGG